MQRDPSLIRQLLFYTEQHHDGSHPMEFPVTSPIADWLPNYEVPCDLDDEGVQNLLRGHLQLMIDSGLADGTVHVDTKAGRGVVVYGRTPDPWFNRLTPDGFDLLDAIREDTVWSKVREKIATVGGGVSISLLKTIATKVILESVA